MCATSADVLTVPQLPISLGSAAEPSRDEVELLEGKVIKGVSPMKADLHFLVLAQLERCTPDLGG